MIADEKQQMVADSYLSVIICSKSVMICGRKMFFSNLLETGLRAEGYARQRAWLEFIPKPL